MPVQAVLFDLGNTLVFEAHAPDRERLYRVIGERVRPLILEWGGNAGLDVATLIAELYRAIDVAQPVRRARGLEVDVPFIVRGALAEQGVEVSDEQAQQFWRRCAIDISEWGWQSYPDTLDALRRLRALELPVAIVTNSWYPSDTRRASIASFGITDDLVAAFVSSADLLRPKPRPEPFLRALDALDVSPSDAVFVGDDLEADVRGAKALGMATVWKLNGRHEIELPEEADYAIHDLWELFTLDLLPSGAAAALPEDSLTPHEDANADRY